MFLTLTSLIVWVGIVIASTHQVHQVLYLDNHLLLDSTLDPSLRSHIYNVFLF